jgi:glycosyltransferase involved in cell wall biosynthesis
MAVNRAASRGCARGCVPDIVNVLHVDHTSLVSGAERALLDLIRSLPGDVRSSVLCPSGDLADRVRAMDVPVRTFPGTGASFRLHPVRSVRALVDIARSVIALRRTAQEVQADLVHANSIRAAVIAVLARALGGPPVVTHIHDSLPDRALSRAVCRFLWSRSNAVVAVSEHSATRFLDLAGAERDGDAVTVVYNPIDSDRFQLDVTPAEARRRLGLSQQGPVLGIVAQITPWKGQDTAIRALAEVRKRAPQARLLIVGEPKFIRPGTTYNNLRFAQELRTLTSELGLDNAVEFWGEREDVPLILRALDVSLLPSLVEPLGRAALESMAAGLPVVATTVGGPAEVIEDGRNGLLRPPGDPTAWAEAILSVIEEPSESASMGRAAAETIKQRYSAGRYASSITAIYERVAADEASRASSGGTASSAPHVLFLDHTSDISGAQWSLLDLLAHLPEPVTARVACPSGDLAELVRDLDTPLDLIDGSDIGLSLRARHTPRAALQLVRSVSQTRRLVKSRRPDILHANSTRAGIIAGIAAIATDVPVVVHVRDVLPQTRLAWVVRATLICTSHRLIANAAYTARQFDRRSTKVTVVYNPVDCDRFDPELYDGSAIRAELNLPAEATVLSVVAQITPWKGQRDALEIVRLLRARGRDVRLLIVGAVKFQGPLTRFDNPVYLEELHRLADDPGLRGAVSFLGERRDIPEILSATDVALLPSWEEPFGRAALEAMAMKVPVVATAIGGPAEVIEDGHSGVVLPPREPSLWAKRIDSLLDGSELTALGTRGRERACSTFRMERHVQHVMACYRETAPRAAWPVDEPNRTVRIGR